MNSPETRSIRTAREIARHAEWTVGSLGFVGIVGAFETQTTGTVAAVSGGLAIAAGFGNAIKHGVKLVQAYRSEDASTEVLQPRRPQYQLGKTGFSDRYNAEVEYASWRLADQLEQQGVTEISFLDIDNTQGPIYDLTQELFNKRLSEGYELSMLQTQQALYGAATTLGIYKSLEEITSSSTV